MADADQLGQAVTVRALLADLGEGSTRHVNDCGYCGYCVCVHPPGGTRRATLSTPTGS